MSPLGYVGAAYFCLWILLLAYAWRLTATVQRLTEKLDLLERGSSSS